MPHAFDKFINKKSPAKIKEEFRQKKRKIKAEIRAEGEELRRIKAAKLRGENIEETASYTKKYSSSKDNFSRKKNTSDKRERPINLDKKNRKNIFPQPPATQDRQAFDTKPEHKKTKNYGVKNERFVKEEKSETEQMPLNKYIAHSGVCGRREAAEMVKQGFAKVNGDVVFEPAFKVSEKDVVELKGKRLWLQKKLVYILMNKPKDHITTTKDEKDRKTVLDLLKGVDAEKIYPVGRLDRNTTGVLLLTNDGELAQRLTHPSFEIKKIYEVGLNKPLSKEDAATIANGIELEDGFIKADAVGFTDAKDKSLIGIEIHSGRNRIVRRIFEHLGYEVKKLDRVMFANLTKKNVERGKWRYLSENEIRLLKYMNAGKRQKKI